MNKIEFENSIKNLTPREKKITELIVLGYSTKRIAQTLHNSTRTIETHRQNIAVKFDKCGQGKLVLFLIENKSKVIDFLNNKDRLLIS
ncbi:response regulator transcription factor [Aquimarina agarivorans]|uniref:response regulator transcription factor n=1 Tax=Aquimarina agarivorans TaxID=980584 RepID=UPI000248F30D|nr:LuxR C-terminal-related transcriptional regulator [Aquimarina agarivorans]